MSQKAKSGEGLLGSPVPYGYRLIEGKFSINEPEADVVREIFQRYCGGDSLEDLRRHLGKKGILTRMGKEWSKMSLAHILHNPIYMGAFRWDGVTRAGNHSAIVDSETFDEVQKISSSKMKNRPHAKERGTNVFDHPATARQIATPQEG
jgi:site-specific DNA recombinase